MKKFLIDYIEEIVHCLAITLICISAYFVSVVLGLFVTGVMLILIEKKIIEVKKMLARKGGLNENRKL